MRLEDVADELIEKLRQMDKAEFLDKMEKAGFKFEYDVNENCYSCGKHITENWRRRKWKGNIYCAKCYVKGYSEGCFRE